jgi:tetratricopeptide (TPR) repeat protein
MCGALLLTMLLAGPAAFAEASAPKAADAEASAPKAAYAEASAATAADAQANQAPTLAEAAELARQGNNQAALDAYRRVAAANPRDHQARLGIARMHLAMSHPELAEPVFRSVLLEDPTNAEAMLGVGRSLADLGRVDEALIQLDRATKAAPANADAQAALGRAHLKARNTTLAVSYLEQAVAASPTPENLLALEDARREHRHSLQLGGLFEHFNTGIDDSWGGDLRLRLRLKDRLRLLARGEVLDKFGVSDARGGAGLEWYVRPDTIFTIQGLGGPDNLVLPRADGRVSLTYQPGTVAWSAAAQVTDFSTATMTTLSPEMTWWADRRTSVGLRYTLAITSFDSADDMELASSGALTGSYRFAQRAWFNLGYWFGIEDFDTLTIDRIGHFSAHTVGGGLGVDLRSLTTIQATYQYQWRGGDEALNRALVVLRQSF